MMKKTITILLSLGMILCLATCGNSVGEVESPSMRNSSVESRAGNDAGNGVQAQNSDTKTEILKV